MPLFHLTHPHHTLRYIYVYLEYTQNPITDDQSLPETGECFEPKTVSLERTGTIKIVTVSALISHFLPYFNSSINPIIYNIMSGKLAKPSSPIHQCLSLLDRFRLKFRELLSSCCCRPCRRRTISRMQLTSSSTMPFKSSSQMQHSPVLSNTSRYSRSYPLKTVPSSGSARTRHTGAHVYSHNGPICFR